MGDGSGSLGAPFQATIQEASGVSMINVIYQYQEHFQHRASIQDERYKVMYANHIKHEQLCKLAIQRLKSGIDTHTITNIYL